MTREQRESTSIFHELSCGFLIDSLPEADMRSLPPRHQPHARADHADMVVLDTASGVRVELMRASYQTQVFPRHAHEYFTLGVMLSGAGTLWYRGENRTTHQGDVVLIPPGEIHTGGPGRDADGLCYFAAHVPTELLDGCAEAHGLRGGRAPDPASPIIQDSAIAAELRRLNVATDTRRASGGEAEDSLNTALDLLLSRHTGAVQSGGAVVRVPRREPQLVRLTREIIADCYGNGAQTSLRALAHQAGVTPCHLVRVFTRATGLSPHRYLLQTRVQRASQLLARGTPSSFVAAMTGFVDQSHLTTQFKRYTGMTPASYQRCMVEWSHRP